MNSPLSSVATSLTHGLILACATLAGTTVNAQWDPNQTYVFHTRFQGPTTALDVIEGGADDKDVVVTTRDDNDTGQYWRITKFPGANPFWRLSSVLLGKDMSVDIYNGGPKNNRTHIVPTGPFTGQLFQIAEIAGSGGYYRLTTAFRGPTLSLEGAGGPTTDRPCLKSTGPFTGQMWRITPTELPQPLLYYKFDRGQGDIAVNYGSDDVDSTMVNTGTPGAWASPGQEGPAMLAGSALGNTDFRYCDTGKVDGLSGDLTIQMWVNEATTTPGGALSYLFGGMGSFRCFTGGVAGTTLWVRNALAGSTFNIIMPTVGDNFQVRAQSGMFVTLVVKGLEAQWYVDGAPHGSAITLPVPLDIPGATSSFKVGKHISDFSCSVYDMDEFKLYNRAASAAEIARWATSPDAAAGAFGNTCGVTLGTAGGPPRVGNSRYSHTIDGPPNMRFLFSIGVSIQPGFDMGVVFPTLSGCNWYCGFDIQLVAATGASGMLTLPGGVPNDAALAGGALDTQVLGFVGPSPSTKFQSNAVSHKIELF